MERIKQWFIALAGGPAGALTGPVLVRVLRAVVLALGGILLDAGLFDAEVSDAVRVLLHKLFGS